MTYAELQEHVWGRCGDWAARVEVLDPPTRRAFLVLDLLKDRQGFGGWWDGIDDDVKEDIFNEIREVVRD